MRTGKRACEQLVQFFKDRAALEEEYSKKLAKIAKNFMPRDELGSLKDVYEALRLEMDVSAKAHLDASNDMKAKFEKPTLDFLNGQSTVRKQVSLCVWLFMRIDVIYKPACGVC